MLQAVVAMRDPLLGLYTGKPPRGDLLVAEVGAPTAHMGARRCVIPTTSYTWSRMSPRPWSTGSM